MFRLLQIHVQLAPATTFPQDLDATYPGRVDSFLEINPIKFTGCTKH